MDFELIEINLDQKPEWFEKISPYSKVPVLLHDDAVIYESSVINEYLDEITSSHSLLPSSPLERAAARIWIDFDNAKIIPIFYKILLSQDEIVQEQLKTQMMENLHFLEREGFSNTDNGPFWFGRLLSLVDIAMYPHFERFGVLAHYRGLELPTDCTKIRTWLNAMKELPSVRQTTNDDDYHIAAYETYAHGTASGTTAKDMQIA
jgi:glutathione S-transferase